MASEIFQIEPNHQPTTEEIILFIIGSVAFASLVFFQNQLFSLLILIDSILIYKFVGFFTNDKSRTKITQ